MVCAGTKLPLIRRYTDTELPVLFTTSKTFEPGNAVGEVLDCEQPSSAPHSNAAPPSTAANGFIVVHVRRDGGLFLGLRGCSPTLVRTEPVSLSSESALHVRNVSSGSRAFARNPLSDSTDLRCSRRNRRSSARAALHRSLPFAHRA